MKSSQVSWFAELDEQILNDLTARFEPVQLAPGQVLFEQDDPGDAMYLVNKGRLEILIEDQEGKDWLVDFMEPGDFVGEMALVTGQRRVALVRASKAVELSRLWKTDFDELSDKYPELLRAFGIYMGPKLQRTQLVVVLSSLFGAMDMETFHELQQRSDWLHFRTGQSVKLSTEPEGSMYIVINGRIRLDSVSPDGASYTMGEMGRAQTLGEFNLLSGENEDVIFTAIRDTDIVRLSREEVEDLLRTHPESIFKFAKSAALRIQLPRSNLRQEQTTTTTFALVPLQEGVPLAEMGEQLQQALDSFGTVQYLSSESFDNLYGKEGAAQTMHEDPASIPIVSWLMYQEQFHQFVLYECDKDWSPWTQRCLRQADVIILVARAGGPLEKSKMEYGLEESGRLVRQELVLLHPQSAQLPSGTRAWLDSRPGLTYHQARLSHDGDFKRLVRRLLGREIAVVFSGGASHGYAHAGVYRALMEAGVPVDMIGSASMGALVGGVLAQGDNFEQVIKHGEKWGSPRTVYDYTLPVVSFMASHKLTRNLQSIFGERRIEDLWQPFFCVSTNLSKSELVVHREGLLWEAVRGSVAIPGVFLPYIYRGDVLVDGGVMNNFPIDLMRKDTPTGWIIGVNLSHSSAFPQDYNFKPGLSGWHVILSRLNPFNNNLKAPNIITVLTRSNEVRGNYQMALVGDEADTLLQPPVDEWPAMNFQHARAIAEAGYQSTLLILDDLVSELNANGFRLG